MIELMTINIEIFRSGLYRINVHTGVLYAQIHHIQ